MTRWEVIGVKILKNAKVCLKLSDLRCDDDDFCNNGGICYIVKFLSKRMLIKINIALVIKGLLELIAKNRFLNFQKMNYYFVFLDN